MEAALTYSPVRPWIIASGLAHLGLFAFFAFGPKLQFQMEKPQLVEFTLVAPKPVAAVASPAVPRPKAQVQNLAAQPVPAVNPAAEAVPAPAEPAAASAESESATQEILSAYEMEVASRLNALKQYPDAAKRMRQQGRVMVRFKLTRDGQVVAREIVEPCPHRALNEAAASLLARIQEFKPFPNGTTVSSWVFTVPIEYRL